MRSIRYRLTHRPCTLDDCPDLAHKVPITEMRLDKRYHDPIREQYPIAQLFAQFEVKQGDKVRTVETLCGEYLHSNSQEKKISEVNRSNTKLRRVIGTLSAEGVVVGNPEQEFEHRLATQD